MSRRSSPLEQAQFIDMLVPGQRRPGLAGRLDAARLLPDRGAEWKAFIARAAADLPIKITASLIWTRQVDERVSIRDSTWFLFSDGHIQQVQHVPGSNRGDDERTVLVDPSEALRIHRQHALVRTHGTDSTAHLRFANDPDQRDEATTAELERLAGEQRRKDNT